MDIEDLRPKVFAVDCRVVMPESSGLAGIGPSDVMRRNTKTFPTKIS